MEKGNCIIYKGLIITAIVCSVIVGTRAYSDDVIENATIAQQRLRQLATAVALYQNDNEDWTPFFPSQLFGHKIDDPEVFHNPGDSDPIPKTIDNDFLNEENSSQISFTYFNPFIPVFGDPPIDALLFIDNSAENNGGRFVNFVDQGGHLDTFPSFQLPYPTKNQVARVRLRRIGRYARDNHNQRYHLSLLDIWRTGQFIYTFSFWNPGDNDSQPSGLLNNEPNGHNSAAISFEFPAAGMSFDTVDDDTVILRDNDPSNNDGVGILEFVDDRVRFVVVLPWSDVNRDCHVDLLDFGEFQRCLTLSPIIDNECRLLDRNDSDGVTLFEFDDFVADFTGPIKQVPDCPR